MFIVFVLSFMMFQYESIHASAFGAPGKAAAESNRPGITADNLSLSGANNCLKKLETTKNKLLGMLIQSAHNPDTLFDDPLLQEDGIMRDNVNVSGSIDADYSNPETDKKGFWMLVKDGKKIAMTPNYRTLIKSLYPQKPEGQK